MKASVVCPDGVGDGALSDARQRALRPQLRSCGEWPSSSSKMSVSPSHFEPTVISSFVGEIVFMRGSAVLDPDPCPVQSSKIDLYSLSPLRLVTTLRLYYTYTTPRPILQPRSSRRLVFPPPSSWRLDEHGVGPPTAWTTARDATNDIPPFKTSCDHLHLRAALAFRDHLHLRAALVFPYFGRVPGSQFHGPQVEN